MAVERLRYHVADDPDESGPARRASAFRGDALGDVTAPLFTSDEGAARFYLDQLMTRDGRQSMRSAAAPERPEQAAEMALESAQDLPATRTRLVRFAQRHDEIAVFGAEAVVELDHERSLVSADVRVGEVPDIGPFPTLDASQAIANVAGFVGIDLQASQLPLPTLVYFHDDQADRWHLAWHVRSVPALPAEARPNAGDRAGHGLGRSFRSRHEHADYLVDAHDGAVVYYYGTAPTIGIPVKCKGTDEGGQTVEFYGAKGDGTFSLLDPLRRVRTIDFALGDIDTSTPPTAPLAHNSATFGDEHRGAVTAHHHAALVQDYFKNVLQRDGIDDKGMELVSIVNTTCAKDQDPPGWMNACWWDNRMWYGQVKDDSGRLVSLALYLDVIAHELTHGVIDTTSGLIYRNQSGALNESFADIFGILIANSYRASDPADVSTWDWRMGAGLGRNGSPLRDFADPASVGDPDHMKDYVKTIADLGGVHTNSSIHNKAVHALLSHVDAEGKPTLSVEEVATILYLALVHLPKAATFADAREKAIDVAKVYFSGDSDRSTVVEAAIVEAYDSVGIS